MDSRAVNISEAAAILGLSKEAIRKRIKRGTLNAVKSPEGEWMIMVDWPDGEDAGQDTGRDTGRDASSDIIAVLNDRITDLQAQIEKQDKRIERQDHILMALTQKIPQLEAPRDPGLYHKENYHSDKYYNNDTVNSPSGSDTPDYADDSFPFDQIPFNKPAEPKRWWKFGKK